MIERITSASSSPMSASNLAQRKAQGAGGEQAAGKTSFSDMVQKAVEGVNQSHLEAENKAADLLAGRTDNVHDVSIAMQRSKLSFELMTEIRNKLLDTYKEVSRIQM